MGTNPDIPHKFRASVFPDYVRIVTANAVINAQYVERVFNGICLMLETDGLKFSVEDFMSDDSARTRQTLGMIEKQLSKTSFFEASFSARLTHFTHRRNRVVHGLFADSFKSHDEINIESRKAQDYVQECQWVAQEAAKLVEVGFGIYRVLGNVVSAANPNQPQLDELLSGFDEFYDVGSSSIARELRPHLESQKADRSR